MILCLRYIVVISLTILLWVQITSAVPMEDGNKEVPKNDTIDILKGLNDYLEASAQQKENLIGVVQIIEKILDENIIDNHDTDILRLLDNEFGLCGINNLIYYDSLLRFELIPPRLLEKFSLYLEYNYINSKDKETVLKNLTYDSEFPASDIYADNWNRNIPNPYPRGFADNDTLLKLKLINDFSDFHIPGEGRISSRYGWRNGRLHSGVDIAVYQGLPIYAVFPGVVRMARTYGGYGRIIIIRHDNGLETYYAHLSRIRVKSGQRVEAGEIIGNSGNSGSSDGTHLHFEIRYKGIPFNPAQIICFKENKLLFTDVILKKTKTSYFVYTEDAILYKVQRGDYPHRIAQEFGITVAKLREDNDMSARSHLRVGQVLRINP
jgi:murein DD-endopeptidase MepM/ murein hydrolase activator NlpD